MSCTVEIKNQQRRFQLNRRGIESLVCWVLAKEGWIEAEVSLFFVNNGAIQQLNRQYLDRDYPTDVLAFPQREEGEGGIRPRLLGDVVISTQKVKEQAPLYRQKIEDEFCLCLIHGLLHLLGYRDSPPRFRQRMELRENRLLTVWKECRKLSLIKS